MNSTFSAPSVFDVLTPDTIIASVERASGLRCTGLLIPLPSYINRVYELRAIDGTKLIAKFYRPGRWTREAILAEHSFVEDCQSCEVPVVAPQTLINKSTIDECNGILFSIFPKRAGRQFELNSDNDYIRVGGLIARLHAAGARSKAPSRITMHPHRSLQDDLTLLIKDVLPQGYRENFKSTALRILDTAVPLFDKAESIRIHGDCHCGNILDRLDEGLLVIDFDDMAMGPPVQDIWLMMPDRPQKCPREIDLFLSGYERYRTFDRRSLRLIEPLRAMRMIYFLAWCSKQRNDYQFKKMYPDWGNDAFWQREIGDLREQLGFVMEAGEFNGYEE